MTKLRKTFLAFIVLHWLFFITPFIIGLNASLPGTSGDSVGTWLQEFNEDQMIFFFVVYFWGYIAIPHGLAFHRGWAFPALLMHLTVFGLLPLTFPASDASTPYSVQIIDWIGSVLLGMLIALYLFNREATAPRKRLAETQDLDNVENGAEVNQR